MPLLQKADRVTVLTVIGGTEVSGPSAEQLVRNLRRNWIGAELKKAELDGRSTGETILATAQSLGCDLLIKGAYTQRRSADRVSDEIRAGDQPDNRQGARPRNSADLALTRRRGD
jgi:hypothetical protein